MIFIIYHKTSAYLFYKIILTENHGYLNVLKNSNNIIYVLDSWNSWKFFIELSKPLVFFAHFNRFFE